MPDASHANNGTILLDGWLFPVEGGLVNIQNMNSYQRKNVIGDYQRDSNPITSSWVLYDFTGGSGVQSLEEGADAGRYSFGVIDPRRARQVTCPPETLTFLGTAGNFYPLGVAAGDFYGAFGVDIHRWDENAKAYVDTGADLDGVPRTPGIRFKGLLFIPLGVDGYDTWDGTTVTANGAKTAAAFAIWDVRLMMVDIDGQLHATIDGSTWVDYDPDDASIDESFTPRNILPFYDRQGFPMPLIVTDGGFWSFDPSGPTTYRTGDTAQPQHPSFGLGSTIFAGEVYCAIGMGVQRFNGQVQAPVGLDRDQGLPAEIRGKIVSMLGEYNGLYALVSGAESAGSDVETWVFDEDSDSWYVATSAVVSSLHIYTTYGWHCYWTSGGAAGTPTFLATSSVDSTYRLWWGIGETACSIELPFDFANARALIESGTGKFAASGYLETGGFDAGMVGQTKLANTIAVRTSATSLTSRIGVSYRILDEGGGWQFMGDITEPGQTVFQFGPLDGDFGLIHEGTAFQEIEFRFSFTRDPDDVSAAPIFESAAFSFLKIMPPFHSFTAKMDFSTTFDGKSPTEMVEKMESLMQEYRYITMLYRDEVFRVRVSAGGGSDFTGMAEDRSSRTYNFIEITEAL